MCGKRCLLLQKKECAMMLALNLFFNLNKHLVVQNLKIARSKRFFFPKLFIWHTSGEIVRMKQKSVRWKALRRKIFYFAHSLIYRLYLTLAVNWRAVRSCYCEIEGVILRPILTSGIFGPKLYSPNKPTPEN